MDINQKLNLGNFKQPISKPLPSNFNQINLPKPNSLPKPVQKIDTGFKLVDVSKGKFHDSSLSQGNFRFRTAQALKSTLKSSADRQKVANMLWDRRGGGGIAKWEVKEGLKKLGLADHQIRAVRRKLGAY